MNDQDLLIEIGTEELPPKALSSLSAAFTAGITSQLAKAGLGHGAVQAYASPRRLALWVKNLALRQPDQSQTRLGPAVQAAFDKDGNPTKAAEGFARSCGVEMSALGQKSDGKILKLAHESVQRGASTSELLPDMVRQALDQLPVPKRMRWGSSREEFVRPVHWLILLLGQDVIPASMLGVQSGRDTRGHRFLHPDSITVQQASSYAIQLETEGRVIADFSARREQIRAQILQEGQRLGATPVIDEELLAEVTALVEWPVALTGSFNQEFLAVPMEALVSSMKSHQKCFHLLDEQGQILPNFITISNLPSSDPAQVIAGNEKVIRPRLADAAFFYNQDKKQPLASRIDKLKTVIFQQQLGTVYEKSQRVARLAEFIAGLLGSDVAYARRAAELGKCDLVSSMVYEFAELQGIMGAYYARADGEPEEVAQALNEQYMPRFAGDQLPNTATGMVLALAERLDTITGLFGIGQPPTGSRDPFALRRAALGLVRIIIEKRLPLDLGLCINTAIAGFDSLSHSENLQTQVQEFIIERLRTWYADQGIGSQLFQAVAVLQPGSPLDFDARIKAVHHFMTLPQAHALAAANKRVSNILAKSADTMLPPFDLALAQEPAESTLWHTLQGLRASVDPLLAEGEYQQALVAMAALQPDVDAFFDTVMVNVEDASLRNNRLALLQTLRTLFLQVADISLIQND
ncbi:MAG TPA: glycine--tRNA ligase subunit beta [Pseudomonadaceae bacterium]|nr:glycine--tRNA ligase subunit beta [Pseudomonadaceae bacterium]